MIAFILIAGALGYWLLGAFLIDALVSEDQPRTIPLVVFATLYFTLVMALTAHTANAAHSVELEALRFRISALESSPVVINERQHRRFNKKRRM